MLFSNLPLSPPLSKAIEELGYTQMTPIQEQAIPILLKGRDFIGQSKTGSGKTACFVIPMLEKVRVETRKVQAVILCPTRELASQVANEVRRFGRKKEGLFVLELSGGQKIGPQLGALEKGAHVVVGTPGRVNDLLLRRKLCLKRAHALILDEADRMLDMGFSKEMQVILAKLPGFCQRVFFSATTSDTMKEMSAKYQHQPRIIVIKEDRKEKPKIKQVFYKSEPKAKIKTLINILIKKAPSAAIIFTNRKLAAKEAALDLEAAGISCAALHGDLMQCERDRVMTLFRNQSIKALVATDVAARGIDVADLDLVVNYELPHNMETYIHRIGRTARAGKSGLAVTLVNQKEVLRVKEMQEATGQKIEVLLAPKVLPHKGAFEKAPMATLSIHAGRKNKLRPTDILGALTGEAGGLKGEDVGKIEIKDRVSYVAVRAKVARHAFSSLEKGKVKGRRYPVEMVTGP